jgi:hypothetical protein
MVRRHVAKLDASAAAGLKAAMVQLPVYLY